MRISRPRESTIKVVKHDKYTATLSKQGAPDKKFY